MCEDYPCCGHTDGLGCDWVSPSEVVACPVCIEARAFYPYHEGWEGSCPTLKANARDEASRNVPADFECEECGDNETIYPGSYNLCFNCGLDEESESKREGFYSGDNEWVSR